MIRGSAIYFSFSFVFFLRQQLNDKDATDWPSQNIERKESEHQTPSGRLADDERLAKGKGT